MSMAILNPVATERMDAAFGTAKAGIRTAPLSTLESISLNERLVWCVTNGVYQVPTYELVDTLAGLIASYKQPLEICAGHGVIGRSLGVLRTDSYLHTTAAMRVIYASLRQPVTEPPEDVEKLDALAAIRAYNPEVVFGCFVTQLGGPEVEQSSPYGVDELMLLKHPSVRRYVMVGNIGVHGKKQALRLPHEKLHLGEPWLASRALDQGLNCIYVWDNPDTVDKAITVG